LDFQSWPVHLHSDSLLSGLGFVSMYFSYVYISVLFKSLVYSTKLGTRNARQSKINVRKETRTLVNTRTCLKKLQQSLTEEILSNA